MPRVVMSAAVGCVGALLLLVPVTTSAQERASIVGGVQDASGAVLPGVTVEASSPALIEQVRVGVTDGSGRYAIIDLRPGTYVVTFSLPGFRTVRREGIVLQGDFAAQVNAELAVGAIEESITVTGASPVVDLQSTQNQFVLSRQMVEVLPGARSIQTAAALVPGVQFYRQGFRSEMSIHGSVRDDQHIYQDGMDIGQNLTGAGGQGNGTGVNELAAAELVFDAGAQSAENALGGVRMNAIPKEGGNVFSGVSRYYYSSETFQQDNVPAALQAFVAEGDRLRRSFETNTAVGGPIRRDRLWYFTSLRWSQADTWVANTYFPDGQPANRGAFVAPHATVRFTSQVSPRNKVGLFYAWSSGGAQRYDVGQNVTSGNRVSIVSPEAAYALPAPLQWSAAVKWSSPVSSRLLLEVNQSLAIATYRFHYQPENGLFDVENRELSTNRRTVASSVPSSDYKSDKWNTLATVSYVTGSHALKAGVNQEWGYDTNQLTNRGDMSVLSFLNGRPRSVTVRNTPVTRRNDLKADLGLFAQDKWTLDRLTLTGGVRYDYFNASIPPQTAAAGRFVPAREAAAIACVPCWTDWAIRGGGSYDLWGTGKTALKFSVGKFLQSQALGLASAVNPMGGQSDSRSWTDRDGNGRALDAEGNVQWAEIGPSRNSNFGLPIGATRFDANLPRTINWEESVSIQHELLPNVSVTAGYYRRHFNNLNVTRNLLVDPDRDYTPFTITAPGDPRLPNGGGEVITLYNLNADKLGAVNNVRTWSEANTRVYNGFEVSLNARLPNGGFVFGSTTTERTATSDCDIANRDPNTLRFCHQVPPFRTLYKTSAMSPLPYGVELSGSVQARPGIEIGSDYAVDSAIAGVPLTGGGTLTVRLVDPTTRYYDYVVDLDLRVARTFRLGQARVQGFVEIFNLANLSTVLTVNETFGPLYLQPQAIMQGRRTQIGVQVNF